MFRILVPVVAALLVSTSSASVATDEVPEDTLRYEKGADYKDYSYGEDSYKGSKDACRYIHYDDVKCSKSETKKISHVMVKDYYNKCKKKTMTEKKTISVRIRRDICRSSIKPIRVSTTIPITKQVCDDFPKDYAGDGHYKKTPDCKIIKDEKVIYTTDHVTKWTCYPDYKEETLHVPVKFYKEVCSQYPKKRKVTIPIWVKEKKCWVEAASKKVCGSTNVEKLYESSGKSYYDDGNDYDQMKYGEDKVSYTSHYDDSSNYEYDDYDNKDYGNSYDSEYAGGGYEEYSKPEYGSKPAYKPEKYDEYKPEKYDEYMPTY